MHVVEERLALFLAHGAPLFGAAPIDGALDLEQRVEAQDRLQSDRGDRLALLAVARLFLDIGQFEETPPRMGEAERRRDRRRFDARIEQRLEAIVAVGLQDAGEPGQMLLRMLASPVAGGVIDRRRRRGPGEGPVVADIAPDPPRRTLALGQDTQGGVVAVQPLGRHDVALDQVEERHEGEGPMADLVGQRRQRQVDPLAFEAGALPVERGVHAELVEQDRRQQLRADQAARRCVEGRGRLADLLAVPTGELLAHRLDQFEPARDLLQRPGHVFADLGQAQAAAAGASRRRLDDHALALDVLRPRFADRPFACKGADLARLGAAACAASSSSVAAAMRSSSSNSNCSTSRAVRSERWP